MKHKIINLLILGLGIVQVFASTPQTSENTFLFCLKPNVEPLEIARNSNEVIVSIEELMMRLDPFKLPISNPGLNMQRKWIEMGISI